MELNVSRNTEKKNMNKNQGISVELDSLAKQIKESKDIIIDYWTQKVENWILLLDIANGYMNYYKHLEERVKND